MAKDSVCRFASFKLIAVNVPADSVADGSDAGYPTDGAGCSFGPVDDLQYFHKIGNMKPQAAVTRLAALAQESRLAIFRLLVQKGPRGLCAGDIAEKLSLPAATLSFHLKELSHAGLLQSRQEGRFIYYAPDFEAMNSLVSYLMENCCGGRSCAPVCAPKPRKEKR